MLTKVQVENLALIYAQAWYALEGKAIVVSVDPNGLFQVHFNDSHKTLLPEWNRKLGFGELLDSLHRITETLQSKKIRSLTERG